MATYEFKNLFMFTHRSFYGHSLKDDGWYIHFIMDIVILLASYDRLI